MTVKIDGTNTVANPAFTGADTDTGLQCGTNELKLVTGGSARATVDSSGRIGLDATPTAQFTGHSLFQIGAQASLGANQALSTTGQTYLTHNLYFDTSGNYQVFNTGSANEGSIIQLVDGSIRFRTSAATTGTPSVGERVRIDANGLKFNGDTAATNALSDYEEGTFSPTIAQWSGTYDIQEGFYTKIGRHVIATGRVRTNGGTGSFQSNAFPQISIPFPTSNVTRAGSAVEGHWSHASGQTSTLSNSSTVISGGHFDAPTNGSAMFPNNFRGGDVLGNYNTNNLSNSSDVEMRFSMSYHVD